MKGGEGNEEQGREGRRKRKRKGEGKGSPKKLRLKST